MLDAAQLRELAARVFALAMHAKDQNLLEQLCVRAGEYLDQAMAIETAQRPATNAKAKH